MAREFSRGNSDGDVSGRSLGAPRRNRAPRSLVGSHPSVAQSFQCLDRCQPSVLPHHVFDIDALAIRQCGQNRAIGIGANHIDLREVYEVGKGLRAMPNFDFWDKEWSVS